MGIHAVTSPAKTADGGDNWPGLVAPGEAMSLCVALREAASGRRRSLALALGMATGNRLNARPCARFHNGPYAAGAGLAVPGSVMGLFDRLFAFIAAAYAGWRTRAASCPFDSVTKLMRRNKRLPTYCKTQL